MHSYSSLLSPKRHSGTLKMDWGLGWGIFLSPFPMWSHFLPSFIDFTLLVSLLKMKGRAHPVEGVGAQALTLITPVVAICPMSPSFSLFFL